MCEDGGQGGSKGGLRLGQPAVKRLLGNAIFLRYMA
jgi:hypothetical protein